MSASCTSALTLTEDLATAPAASDQVVLGGIAWQAKSGFTTAGEEYRQKQLRSVTVRHAPLTRGHPAALGLKDDAACLRLSSKDELIVTADALVANSAAIGATKTVNA
jgi:hypothetical protein